MNIEDDDDDEIETGTGTSLSHLKYQKGIAMGLEAQMDTDIYDEPSRNRGNYLTEIDPNFTEDNADELEQDLNHKRQQQMEDGLLFKDNDDNDNDNNHDGYNINDHNNDDTNDELIRNQKRKQIGERYNEYQKQAFARSYTPARNDPLSTPAIQESLAKLENQNQNQNNNIRQKIPESQKQEVTGNEVRTYREVMQERELAKERQDLIRVMEGKKSLLNNEKSENNNGINMNGNDDDDKNKMDQKKNLKRRWDVEVDENDLRAPKRSRWDATPAVDLSGKTPSQWQSTPAVAIALTPGYGWGATPGAMTPGAITPGAITPGAMTPGATTPFGRSKGSKTPGLGWQETPGPGSSTPGIGYGQGTARRWDATPGQATPFGTTPFGVTPGMTPNNKMSRWDATPDVRGGMTPLQSMSKFQGAPLATPISLQTPATTPANAGLMTPATPIQEYYGMKDYRVEIEARNQPLTDEDIEKALEGVKGYEIIEPPATYVPRSTPLRARLLATPTPLIQKNEFSMQATTPGVVETSQGFAVPDEEDLFVKHDDLLHFGTLIEKKDEDVKDPEESKKRTILKLILKVKNGTPPQRKAALRQLSDKARWFGAGTLFDTILPLLMSPTLEDQERHLLVKVIDRILYKLDDLVRPYVHKILVVIEPLLIDEDYYARVEGREIIANLSKAAGLATMISTMRPDIDNPDEYVRNTTARAFSVVASALGIPVLIPFLKAVCQSKKSWEARHTGVKIIQQIAILMGCAVLPHLRQLVEIIEEGLVDEQSKVRTITALALAALAEAAAPYGIEAFDSVLRELWKGISNHRGKTRAAFLKAIGYIIPLMDAEYASYYTREVMPQLIQEFGSPDEEMKKIVLKVIKQCVSTEGVEASYVIKEIIPEFFKNFWNRRMALDRRNYKQLVETTVEIAQKVGGAQIISRIVEDLRDENETYRRMVMETVDKVITLMGVADIDQKLEEMLIDGILYAFQEQTVEDSQVVLSGFGTALNALDIRCQPYLPQICGIVKFRLNNASPRVRQQAADLIARIAPVIKTCNEMRLLHHLGKVLYEFLGEEYPDVLGSILGALKAVVNVVGMEDMQPPIKDLLPSLTPIMKNRHEKVQENCIDLVGRIADRGSEYVSPREWMRIAYELLDMLKAHKKGIRRAAVNTFGYIAKAVGPQDVIEILLNNLRVQERQNRVCTTVAIAIVAETCSPFTILPALMNEYRVPELNVQNGVLKALSFVFEYIGEAGRDYVYPIVPLLEDALSDRDLVHRQTACAVVKHLAIGVLGMGCEDALQHLLNYVWPNIFETSPHLVQAFTEAVEGLRLSLGCGIIFQYLIQGLFHPARRVRNVYWRIYNNLYLGCQDALVAFYPMLEFVDLVTDNSNDNMYSNGNINNRNSNANNNTIYLKNNKDKYIREEMLYFV